MKEKKYVMVDIDSGEEEWITLPENSSIEEECRKWMDEVWYPGGPRQIVEVGYYMPDDDEEMQLIYVEIGSNPPEPPCRAPGKKDYRHENDDTEDDDEEEDEKAEEHDWQCWSVLGWSPVYVVGGHRHKCGYVCSQCGAYRIFYTKTLARDHYPQMPEEIEYREADDLSLAWVGDMADDGDDE
ncbi:MAG: hypothetical protein C4523_01980 [Myxococcales bacterium]|nr:MAG: hypothetical protein C4523_01980 [Myxococcales bacterium]